MAKSQRFPRMRIQEEDFPLQLPDVIQETFLEVVNAQGDVSALFCLVDAIEKRDFVSVDQFATYYDDLFSQDVEKKDLRLSAHLEGCTYLDWSRGKIISKELDLPHLIKGFSAYGRLRFPRGIEDVRVQMMWEGFLSTRFLADLLRYALSDLYAKYQDDVLEIFQFLCEFVGARRTYKNLLTVFATPNGYQPIGEELSVIDIDAFINLDMEIIKPLTSILFTEENIELFIQAAAKTNNYHLQDYIKNYKSIYFGLEGKRIPRVRILERDFPEKIPTRTYLLLEIFDSNGKLIRRIRSPQDLKGCDGDFSFFLDIINDEGETIGLFYFVEPFELEDFPDKVAFTRYYDDLGIRQLEPIKIEANVFMPVEKYQKEFLKLLSNNKVSSWKDYWAFLDIDPDQHLFWEINYEIFLVYGRLKYPYGLDDIDRLNYENCVEDALTWIDEYLFGLTIGPRDEVDYYDDNMDVIKFFLNYFKQKGLSWFDFVKNYISVYSLIRCEIEDIVYFADYIFSNEDNEFMDLCIDEAQEEQNIEVLAFLLDYKNKHFPPEGKA